VAHGGRTVRIAQANNAFIFPGLGLGALVARAREVTDGMLLAAADRLADETLHRCGDEGVLFPTMDALRAVTAAVAAAVISEAERTGLAATPIAEEDIPAAVEAAMWDPAYPTLRPA
jgi:malate dehydrogenase (oxaloacetate-decarboxylating)